METLKSVLIVLICLSLGFTCHSESLKFDFGGTAEDHLPVTVNTIYPHFSGGSIFGFTYFKSLEHIVREDGLNFITSEDPFKFSVKLPEGNYRVRILLGDPEGISNTTIKCENRRLMLYDFSTGNGEMKEKVFVVNVRSARISQNDSIRLKPREFRYLNWDDQLTIEFGGDRPCISMVTIEPIEGIRAVFLCGNSTVVDQNEEPYASWGQMIPLFFKPEVVVINMAESGETLKSFIGEKRLDKIETMIKPGDYLFVEFAHNDQKPGRNHVEPFTSYKEYLMKFVDFARERGAIPVLVTSTNRRTFNESGKIKNSLDYYPEAMRQLAKDEKIALIDLNDMSRILYESLGPEESKKIFVHYPANTFSGQKESIADDTHFSSYGAYQLAKCVVENIRKFHPEIADHLKVNIQYFDPRVPDPISAWKWPVSELVTAESSERN